MQLAAPSGDTWAACPARQALVGHGDPAVARREATGTGTVGGWAAPPGLQAPPVFGGEDPGKAGSGQVWRNILVGRSTASMSLIPPHRTTGPASQHNQHAQHLLRTQTGGGGPEEESDCPPCPETQPRLGQAGLLQGASALGSRGEWRAPRPLIPAWKAPQKATPCLPRLPDSHLQTSTCPCSEGLWLCSHTRALFTGPQPRPAGGRSRQVTGLGLSAPTYRNTTTVQERSPTQDSYSRACRASRPLLQMSQSAAQAGGAARPPPRLPGGSCQGPRSNKPQT